MNRNLVVMIPVFNDWESSYMLFRRLNEVLSLRQVPAALIIIDDGSDRIPRVAVSADTVVDTSAAVSTAKQIWLSLFIVVSSSVQRTSYLTRPM